MQIVADMEIITFFHVENQLMICLRSTSAMSVEYPTVTVTLNFISRLGDFLEDVGAVLDIKLKNDHIDKNHLEHFSNLNYFWFLAGFKFVVQLR